MVASRPGAVRRRALGLAASPPVDALLGLGVDVLDSLVRGRPGLLATLTYHRVDEPSARPDLDPGLISATPSDFARQMEAIARRHRVVSLETVRDAIAGRVALPRRAVLVTFDDAYRDFAQHAWPVMRRMGLPVVLFVPTGFPGRHDRSFWWDRLHAALSSVDARRWPAVETPAGRLRLSTPGQRRAAFEALVAHCKARPHDEVIALVDEIAGSLGGTPVRRSVLGWDELRTLAADGVTLAAHTVDHPLLTRVDATRRAMELASSRDDLERELGGPVPPALAYPAGACDATVTAAARAAGYELGFTTGRGLVDIRRADPLRLGRINVGGRTTTAILRAQLLSVTGRTAS